MTQSNQERIENLEINIDSIKSALNYYIKVIADSNTDQKGQEFTDKFFAHYDRLIKEHEHEDNTDLARLFRLITAFKPALSQILPFGPEYDRLCDLALTNFNMPLNRIRRQLNDKQKQIKKKGAIIPGSNSTMDLQFFCSVCNELFEIPPEMKDKLLNSEETLNLPEHCNKPMVVKIAKVQQKPPKREEDKPETIVIPPAELLMGHQNSEETKTEYLKVLSVGIDIGSSTSHLVFSRITLKRETSFFNMSNRFFPLHREIIYEGNIIFTPLLDKNTIDIEAVVKFCEDEFQKAGISPDMVDTGAVIVTGETAKKQNAHEIADRLSSEAGKFVSATAGPNFESLLGAMGSGIVELSRVKQNVIMNVDVGGGTSNIAVSSKGEVLSCSCINVGGRLLGIDNGFKIWRIDEPTERLLKELNMDYQLGDIIPEEDVRLIAQNYAKALLEVMLGDTKSKIAKMLMMTDDIDLSIPVQEYSFSGGIGELIYKIGEPTNNYNDIGQYLAEEIKILAQEQSLTLIEPENKIRATVIGAGSFSLSVSGSTCFVSEEVDLPITNIPVISVHVTLENLSLERLIEEIHNAFLRFDMVEGVDVVGLYVKEFFMPQSSLLDIFAKAFEQALPKSVINQIPIVLLFKSDLAKLLGLKISRETSIQKNLICLDELTLESGDFIDIGPPLGESHAYPVTIKSLVFNQSKSETQM